MLVARQRLLEVADSLGADAVLALQALEHRNGLGTPRAQPREQVLVFLRVVESLGNRVDVVNHGTEDPEVGLHAVIPDRANEVEHAVQHGGKRTVLVLDDPDRFHGVSFDARPGRIEQCSAREDAGEPCRGVGLRKINAPHASRRAAATDRGILTQVNKLAARECQHSA